MKWLNTDEVGIGPSAKDLRDLAAGKPPRIEPHCLMSDDNRPLYRNLSVVELQSLRCCTYVSQVQDVRDAWVWIEATLRFCEVNCSSLEQRFSELWGRDMAPTLMVLTLALLLEAYLASGDLRFLNTVIKLRTSRLFPQRKFVKSATNEILGLAKAVYDVSDLAVEQCRRV